MAIEDPRYEGDVADFVMHAVLERTGYPMIVDDDLTGYDILVDHHDEVVFVPPGHPPELLQALASRAVTRILFGRRGAPEWVEPRAGLAAALPYQRGAHPVLDCPHCGFHLGDA